MIRSRPRISLRAQIVLTTLVLTALGMLLVTAAFHLGLENLGRRDVSQVLQTRADIAIRSLQQSTATTPTIPSDDLDPGDVVFDWRGRPVAGSPLRRLDREYVSLASVTEPTLRQVDETATLWATPFSTGSTRGVIVVATSLRSYESSESNALLLSIASGVLVVAAAGLVANWITRRALRPVATMASTAAAWSQHDLGRRFDLGSPDNELTSLGATLDRLLDQVAGAIRSEQRLTSELAHELRTPLTTIQGLTDLTLLRHDLPPEARDTLEQVSATSRSMAATVTALLDVARDIGPTHSTSSLTEVVAAAVDAVSSSASHAPSISVTANDVIVDVPTTLALRVMTPVLENAARHALAVVRVVAGGSAPGRATIVIEDDGGGVTADEDIFLPGVTTTGGGLGLSLARRLARTYGGDVVLTSAAHPTTFEIRLPLARDGAALDPQAFDRSFPA